MRNIFLHRRLRQFLPPSNEVWGKVIFSQALVSPSVHGEGGDDITCCVAAWSQVLWRGSLYLVPCSIWGVSVCGVLCAGGSLSRETLPDRDPPLYSEEHHTGMLTCIMIYLIPFLYKMKCTSSRWFSSEIHLTVLLVAQKRYLISLKPVFCPKFLGTYRIHYAKDYFRWAEIQPTRGEIELDMGKLRKLQIPSFLMFGWIWPQVGWIWPHVKSPRINPHKVKLRWGEPPKWNSSLLDFSTSLLKQHYKSVVFWGVSSAKINFMRAVYVQNYFL